MARAVAAMAAGEAVVKAAADWVEAAAVWVDSEAVWVEAAAGGETAAAASHHTSRRTRLQKVREVKNRHRRKEWRSREFDRGPRAPHPPSHELSHEPDSRERWVGVAGVRRAV